MTTEKVFYVKNDDGLTVTINGKQYAVTSDNPRYDDILQALHDKEYYVLVTLIKPAEAINSKGVSRKLAGRRVFVENGAVFYTDTHGVARKLGNALVERIIAALEKPNGGVFADALLALMDNIQKNKLKDIRAELYEFLKSGNMPITYDGCFLAVKKVNSDFTDIYTGTMDNSPGTVVRMKQKDVDTNRHNTCSSGLHFASIDYLPHYSGGSDKKVIVLKVNPRHVFAIPTDYSFQKGRASEYFVIGEYVGVSGTRHDAVSPFKDSFINEDLELSSGLVDNVKLAVSSLRPSLKTQATSLGLLADGKVRVVPDGLGGYLALTAENIDPLTGDEFFEVDVKLMSFETKSVRDAVKAAVEYMIDEQVPSES